MYPSLPQYPLISFQALARLWRGGALESRRFGVEQLPEGLLGRLLGRPLMDIVPSPQIDTQAYGWGLRRGKSSHRAPSPRHRQFGGV